MSSLAAQIGFASSRSVRRVFRQPGLLLIPTITFPLILLAINTAGLDASTELPGFPADSYLEFAIVVCFMQAGLFAATTAGTELASDIQTGFFNRLQLTPLRLPAILIGVMMGAMVVALIDAIAFLVAGFVAGISMEAGLGGVLMLIVLSQVTALAFGAVGVFFGAQTGSPEAVQGLFPLLFVTFFLSSINLPRELIEIDWFRTVATWNPVSYMIEGMRSLVVDGWDGTALARAFAASGAIGALGIVFAAKALDTRMART